MYSQKFHREPTLTAAVESFYIQKHSIGQNKGPKRDDMLQYIAQGLNFKYKYVTPADGMFGSKQENGSWSGMVGMVSRGEADIAIGPFGITENRTEVVDITWPVTIQYCCILGSCGKPEVNSWGFLLPLDPLVWAATLTALFLLPPWMYLLSSCCSFRSDTQNTWVKDTFGMIRILLQQDYSLSGEVWWKRLVVAAWVIVALVLSRSYAGNLMSSLAVRHIRQPYQSIRDVLDDPSTIMVWHTNSNNVQYFRTVDSGIFHEVSNAESKGRIKYRLLSEFIQSTDTLVSRGDHVIIVLEIIVNLIISQFFSKTGRCDFYKSRDKFLPMVLSSICQKNSPLLPAINKRILSMNEAGFFDYWLKYDMPNSTSCVNSPTKITVSTSLSLTNLWIPNQSHPTSSAASLQKRLKAECLQQRATVTTPTDSFV
ncbi:probable glutamate receptor [Cherax quadricarinatus]|uniref:probable glutamate receptor n=1 Tax=Cherax quadricarinatus TaxID=27406 RepID=UPI00387E336B